MLRFALLALLASSDRHGYELKAAFEELLGGTWALNIGQVYTTLARLERDGLVTCHIQPQTNLPDRKTYSLTDEGWAELTEWLSEPADEAVNLKGEPFIKVVLASLVDSADLPSLLMSQRAKHFQALADLADIRDSNELNPVTRLAVEAAMLHLEADLQWLDFCEQHADQLKSR